jgi:transposase-like protein
MQYSAGRKEAVLRKMLPPHNRSIPEIAKQEGISEPTLYNWCKEGNLIVADHVTLSCLI